LHRVVETFLIFSQLELRQGEAGGGLGQGRPLPLAPAVERVVARLAERAGRADDVRLELHDASAAILDDYWAKIVDEIIDNALKFSEAGSSVHVRLAEQGEQCVLAVCDRGRGMKPEHVAQIGGYMQFERRFYEQQGSGLGLVIARRLTELHGGTLSLTSTVGSGTTVEVRLPKAVATAG
jgi:signal transduction histidine kinase